MLCGGMDYQSEDQACDLETGFPAIPNKDCDRAWTRRGLRRRTDV